jgi:hypothetical protein
MWLGRQGGLFVLGNNLEIGDILLAIILQFTLCLAYADVHAGIVSFFVTDDIIGHRRLLDRLRELIFNYILIIIFYSIKIFICQ